MAKKLRVLKTFKKDYKKLTGEIKEKVDKQMEFLLKIPNHPYDLKPGKTNNHSTPPLQRQGQK